MADSAQPDKPEQPRQWVERSRKPDWVLRSVTVVTLVGWIGAMIALILYYLGSQRDSGGIADILRNRNNMDVGSIANSANPDLLRGAFAAIVASFIVCAVGFILNVTRHKRKTDKYNKLLITLWIASSVLIVVFLIGFARNLFA